MRSADIELRSCRVCGYSFDDWFPWGEAGDSPTYAFCPACGVEFGYADASPVGIRRWRELWLEQGAPWNDRRTPHDGLATDERLASVPEQYR